MTASRRRSSHDRPFHIGLRDAFRRHRSARLRAHLRQPDDGSPIRATLIAGFILIFFAMFGEALLSFLHIDLDSFRIAGGVMLFIIAIDMVFEKRTERREQRAEKLMATPEVEDVSVFPMAMPMLAGPGSIASVMLLVSQNSGLERALVIFGALLLVLLLTLAALLLAGPFMRLIGNKGEAVITRLLGVLLAALAAQFVIDGLKASFSSLA
jgi:multiple antibiotic resistance protein